MSESERIRGVSVGPAKRRVGDATEFVLAMKVRFAEYVNLKDQIGVKKKTSRGISNEGKSQRQSK
ncbi:hypothetical protein DAPPUDRAFT_252473 [Daphnia pulex]|uniref:Uncharacterized protein n=1 Tax=Daphnia pulex TaxID=6669 RepID=E9H2S0_DAPPU|nr:hypothetical protein DAPPUDRAFT_252473 [Daphnia pulex]|eukprot:EFX73963.1 hypothetical protein DAPPUDRAFT_252473 [Daphnia pulex]